MRVRVSVIAVPWADAARAFRARRRRLPVSSPVRIPLFICSHTHTFTRVAPSLPPTGPKGGRPGASSLLPTRALEAAAHRFKTLSSPSRLKVLNALMGGPVNIGTLTELTGLEQSNLSRHVAALEQSGCVERRREGQHVVVEIVDPSLKPLCDIVCQGLGLSPAP